MSRTLRKKFTKYNTELNEMSDQLKRTEEKKIGQIHHLSNPDNTKGIYTDNNVSIMLSKLNHELEKIRVLKKQVFNNIEHITEKHEHLLLSIDNIMFDNCVMIDTILKNFKILNNFL